MKICTSHVLRQECLFRHCIFYRQTSSLLFIEQWLDLIRFFVLSKKNYSIWSEALLLSFFYWFDSFLSKIDFWSSKLPERLRGWSAFQYFLRAWFRNPFLSSNFFKNTWTEFGRHKKWCSPKFVKKITKKFVRSQSFKVRISSQTLEVRLSRLVNQTSVEIF